MKLLVCGGRSSPLSERPWVYETLDRLLPVTLLIHGGALGIDAHAGAWAAARGIPYQVFRAKWHLLGHQAGPLCNLQMLVEGKPDLVIAFPGKIGTPHMMRIAREADVMVLTVAPRHTRNT